MLNVRSNCAALDTASRAFPYCPVSRYQLANPLWTEPKLLSNDLADFRRQAFAQAQEPLEPELTILKHRIPTCSILRSLPHGEFPRAIGRTRRADG